MEILLSFQEKPRNAPKKEAIQIAERCGARIENGRVIVPFHKFTPDAKDLFSRCRKWKGFELSINGQAYDPFKVFVVVNCSYNRNRTCDGICHSITGSRGHGYVLIVNDLEWMSKYSQFCSYDTRFSPNMRDWVRVIGDDTIVIDKKGLQDAILTDSTLPLLVCEKCTRERIIERTDRLPEKIIFGLKPGQLKAERSARSDAEREAVQWFNVGVERDNRHDYVGALEAYNRALSLDPNDIGTIFNRGCALLALRRYTEAEASFSRVSTLLPDDAYTFKYWALALQGLGKSERAAELMARAERLKPGIRNEPFP